MVNVAPVLQRTTAKYRRQAKVLAITSGKGGVGKSNIAAKLGTGLASQPYKEGFFRKVVNWFA
ncbi:MAG: P-loop NTPase [Planctomycetota bacterium]|nr:MAG: P-loop NTPase [Planctomycetota bacterium]